jgi:hypothetical protein
LEISTLEAALAEAQGKIPALTAASLTSDAGSGELVSCERRIAVLTAAIQNKNAALEIADPVDLTQAQIVLMEITIFWRETVLSAMLEALAPFGYEKPLILPLLAHCQAMRSIEFIREHAVGYDGLGFRADKIFEIYEKALVGLINLNDPLSKALLPS